MRVALNGRHAVALIFWILISTIVLAQPKAPTPPSASTVCTFADGKEMSARYTPEPVDNKTLPADKLWKPGGAPVLLFTQATITAGTSEIPTGAYTMYFIPAKKQWTLVISRNVDAAAEYNEQQDIARVPMEVGKLSTGIHNLQIVFAHMAPQQCNMRLYRGKTGVWMEFKEKQ
jgi:hypothetical protein